MLREARVGPEILLNIPVQVNYSPVNQYRDPRICAGHAVFLKVYYFIMRIFILLAVFI